MVDPSAADLVPHRHMVLPAQEVADLLHLLTERHRLLRTVPPVQAVARQEAVRVTRATVATNTKRSAFDLIDLFV